MITIQSKFKIFIISADRIAGEGLAALIKQEPNLEVCGLAATALSGSEAVGIARPDLVIFNCSADRSLVACMKDVDGSIAKAVMVREGDDEVALRALYNDASAIVTHRDSWAMMLRAIEAIRDGESFYCERVRGLLVGEHTSRRFVRQRRAWNVDSGQETQGAADLSGREFQVFSLLADGNSTTKIAADLRLSLKTVQAYVGRIKEKRGFKTLHETLIAAIQWRIMSTREVASRVAA